MIENQSKMLTQVYLWGFAVPIFLWLCLFWYWKNIVVHNLEHRSDIMQDQDSVIKPILAIITIYVLAVDLS